MHGYAGKRRIVETFALLVLQKEGRVGAGEGRTLFRVSSSCNERPLHTESLIMSVLIIKRELASTKLLKSHYQSRRGKGDFHAPLT